MDWQGIDDKNKKEIGIFGIIGFIAKKIDVEKKHAEKNASYQLNFKKELMTMELNVWGKCWRINLEKSKEERNR